MEKQTENNTDAIMWTSRHCMYVDEERPPITNAVLILLNKKIDQHRANKVKGAYV